MVAFHNDIRFVTGPAHPVNPAHGAVAAYLQDFTSRYQVALPAKCRRALFLSGHGRQIRVYGGVLLRPRIVIPEHMLNKALPEPAEDQDPAASPPAQDFLYGGLLEAMARIYRRNHLRHSVMYRIFSNTGPGRGRMGRLRKNLDRRLARYGFRHERVINDSFVVINRGYHNLIQYYYQLAFRKGRHLSAGGDHDELKQTTEKILQHVHVRSPEPFDHDLESHNGLHRLAALGSMYQPWVKVKARHPDQRLKRRQRLFIAAMAMGLLSLVLIGQAALYHPVWLEKIEAEQKVIDDRLEKARGVEENLSKGEFQYE